LKFVPIEVRYPPEWIHDPSAPNPKMELANVPIRETWEAMEALIGKGLVRNIGISNFNCQNIMDLVKYAKIMPAVNQVEIHPYLAQEQLVRYCQELGIAITSYSSFGSSSYVPLKMDKGRGIGLLQHQAIEKIAKLHGKSTAQVVLRWNLQRNIVVIPKTSQLKRLQENLIIDFKLSEKEMEEISALNCNERYNDPGVFCLSMGCFYPIYG